MAYFIVFDNLLKRTETVLQANKKKLGTLTNSALDVVPVMRLLVRLIQRRPQDGL